MIQNFLKKEQLNVMVVIAVAMAAHLILKDFVLRLSNNIIFVVPALLPIIWTPLRMSKNWALLYAAILGVFVDILFFTPGLYASVFLCVTFARTYFLQILKKEPTLVYYRPCAEALGILPYGLYIFVLYLIFFVLLSVLELWDLHLWRLFSVRIISNAFVNTLLVGLLDFFFFSSKKKAGYHN